MRSIITLTKVTLAVVSIGAFGLSATSAMAADQTIPLATAGNFSVLAGTTVVNTGLTVINGNLGVSPGTAITGFPVGVVTGTTDADDAAATQAQADLAAAYTAADNTKTLPCTASISGNLGGVTLTPGVYCAGAAIGITGNLTLDFEGDPNALFVFRIDGALTTAAASTVAVIHAGANGETCAPNTFWALNGAAGFGAATDFTGTILANGGVTSGAGTTITGRVLVNGTVTMDSNTVAVCPNPIPPSAALSVAAGGSPNTASPGAFMLYPITATNAGPDAASDASMTAILPVGMDFGAIATPTGWSCTTPAVGASGAVTCTAASFAVGSASFALTARADPSITAGLMLSLPIAVASPTGDPNTTDLTTSVATSVVILPTYAELSLGASGSPYAVAPGGYILYPISVTNTGPDTAANASMTADLPAGLDFGAISAPSDWSCTTPGVGASGAVTCTTASLAAGSVQFELTAQADPGITTNTTLALPVTVASSTSDLGNTVLSGSVTTTVVLPALTQPASPIADPPADAPGTTSVATVVVRPPSTPAVAPTAATSTPAHTTSPTATGTGARGTATSAPTAAAGAHGCVSHLRFTLHLTTQEGSKRGTRITEAALVNAKGHTIKTLTSTPTTVSVDLRGLPGQKLTVRITTKPRAANKTIRVTRTYETCS